MNCLSISLLQTPGEPFAWIRPSELGVSIKSADEGRLQTISQYLSLLGGRIFSFTPISKKRADGTREIRELKIGPSDEGYFPTVARKLTFHPANTEKFIFQPAEVPESVMQGARLLGEAAWRCNLLQVASTPVPECRCVCGVSYPVVSHTCPDCDGENPLGWALQAFGTDLPERFCADLPAELEGGALRSPELQNILSALENFIAVATSEPKLPEDEFDEKGRATALLDYYKNLFVVPEVDKKTFAALAHLREKKYAALVIPCAKKSLQLRQSWATASLGAWAPDESFQEQILKDFSEWWRQPTLDARDGFLKLFRAAALYRPIEKPLRSVAERTGWGDFWHGIAKPALTGLAAYNTFGASLALKAGIAYFKGQKEQERYQAFASAVGDAVTAAQSALASAEQATKKETSLFPVVAEGLGRHLKNLLYADYARSAPEQQKNLVIGLLTGLGLDASGIDALKPRGIKPPPTPPPIPADEGHSKTSLVPAKTGNLALVFIILFLAIAVGFILLLALVALAR